MKLVPQKTALFIVKRVDLIEHGDTRFVAEPFTIGFKLADDGLVILNQTAGSAVNQMKQDGRTFDMAKKDIPKTAPLMCTLDETGNIGNDKFCIIRPTTPRYAKKWRGSLPNDVGLATAGSA